MILFSVGLPGRFAAWCDATIARLVEDRAGPAELMSAETQDEVADNLVRSTAPHLVISSRRPTPPLQVLLADAAAIVVALDDPRRALHEFVAEQGYDIRLAVRMMAESCATSIVCAGLPGARMIHGDDARYDPVQVMGTIAQACGLPIAPATAFSDEAQKIESWWNALDPGEQAVANGALAAYAGSFRGIAFGEIVWDRTLLWRAADPAQNAGVAIEIGESAGPLVAGPEIDLPPGNWACTVTFAVSREAAGAGFDIEIRGTEKLAGASVVSDARGLCSATLLFTIAPGSTQIVSLAIANTAPSPGGRLALGNVVLVSSPAEGTGVPSELTTVLGLS